MILKLIEYITRSHKGISSSTKRTNALKIFEKRVNRNCIMKIYMKQKL